MAPCSPIPLITYDMTKSPFEQEKPLHNRFHPDIPPVAQVTEGQLFHVDCVEFSGGYIKDDESLNDILTVDVNVAHYLSGPIAVVDQSGVPARPGDLLSVELCQLGPLAGHEWGFTSTFPKGAGFLTDHFPNPTKAIWYFDGIYASSRHIPGVRFAGMIHPGVIGTAPCNELLRYWNEREGELMSSGGKGLVLCDHLHQRPLACLPTEQGACLGKVPVGSPEWDRIASEGARTIPGRENGGNCDIKNLTRGAKIYLPVFVEGANLSVGDMHFSQGDGEIAFCGAIEMSGFVEMKCEIIRGGMAEYLTPFGPSPMHVNPMFEIGPLEPRFSEWLVFEGQSVDEKGRQHFLDASIAFKRACLNAIEYFHKFGYSKEQVLMILTAAPCEGRIANVVDVPNACCTIAVPTAIFNFDVRPKKGGIPRTNGLKLHQIADVIRTV